MLSETLFPPNLQSLSLDVIGYVVERRRVQKDRLGSFIFTQNHSSRSGLSQPVHGTEMDPNCMKKLTTQTKNNIAHLSGRSDRKRHASRKLMKQRKLQAQYRIRQKTRVKKIEDTVQRLRDEIPCLRSLRNMFFIGISSDITMQVVVAEYFRVFRQGF
uniref:BZIP domain-containing protein n=1 Tax=Phytophthora infestans TaxID=4787 RepID=Q572I4_PHYIN|nr:hypothetical protein PI35.0420c [Phytophthora infestans]